MSKSKDLWEEEDQNNLFNFISNFGKNPEDSILDIVLALPLDKKIAFLMANKSYLKYVQTFEKNFSSLLRKGILRIVMPEITENDKLVFNEVTMDYKDTDQIRRYAVRLFFKDFFGTEQTSIPHKFFKPDAVFSQEEHKLMLMFVTLLKDQPESIWTAFVPQNDSEDERNRKRLTLTHFLEKDLIDCADVIGEGLSKNAKAILNHGNSSMDETKNETIKENIDTWVAKWLDPRQLSDQDVQTKLMNFLEKTPDNSCKVFSVILPYIHTLPENLQAKIWENLFDKLNRYPESAEEMAPAIQRCFTNQENTPKVQNDFYDAFSIYLPAEIRAKIVGQFSTKAQKKYWAVLSERTEDLPKEMIQTQNGSSFFAWHLLQQGIISPDQMSKVLEKLDPKKNIDFFFSMKKILHPKILVETANRLAKSSDNLLFWKWIRSFQQTYEFGKRLADLYPDFSDQVRGNEEYVKRFNTHFDLVYRLACLGNTSALVQVKKKLQPDDFWKSLTQEHEDHTSGFSALCHLGKRGLFDLIEDLPLEHQKELFQKKNSQEKSALDECCGEFLKMVQQKVFDQENNVVLQEPVQQVQDGTQTSQPTTEQQGDKSKALYPRKKLFLPDCLKVLQEYQRTNTALYSDLQAAIDDLVTMSGTRLNNTIREDLINNGLLNRDRICVRHIQKKFCLAYKAVGNADQNEGKIVFLFILPHQKAMAKLWNSGADLIKRANEALNSTGQISTSRNRGEAR